MTTGKLIGAVIAGLMLLTWTAAALWSMGAPQRWRRWLFAPGRRLTLFIQIGAAIAFCLGVYGQFQQQDSRWRDWSVELISVSVAVLVIDTANRRRAEIEFKQSIIRQLGSRSNDFALDAARIVNEKGWDRDGSLKRAYLAGANLKDASLWRADLEGADLRFAHLEGADLRFAHLEGAILLGTHLEGAYLLGAYLERADLIGAHLDGTHLAAVYQESTIELSAHLEGALLKSVEYNTKTIWPLGFDPVAAGAILVDNENAT